MQHTETTLPAPIVYVVDDDVSIRESLEALIRWSGWRVETFSSADAFLSRTIADGPHCVVLDVELPDLNGLELQARLSQERSDMPVIFVTGYGDIPMSVRAMKAGAAEFLTKPFDRDVMLAAIRTALDRSRASSEQIAERNILRTRYASLTRREREVLAWVVAGLLTSRSARSSA